MQDVNVNFLDIEAQNLNIHPNSLAYQYLVKKTKASDRGSKARRSLGNLYALYVLCEDYINDTNGSTFSNLMSRMKSLPFGSKLQNHPLDNRLNDEVKRSFDIKDDNLLPVQNIFIGNQKSRKISESFLAHNNFSTKNTAQFIINTINKYIQIISDNQTYFLDQIENAQSKEDFLETIYEAFESNSDARLFEIVSFAILHIYFRKTVVILSINGTTQSRLLTLYRTGRTNANDGGIDFVMKPIGRFYQVTETIDVNKYFLDIDKVQKFPITFVIKSDKESNEIKQQIQEQATQKYKVPSIINKYMSCIEEIINVNDLMNIFNNINEKGKIQPVINEIIIQSKVEFNYQEEEIEELLEATKENLEINLDLIEEDEE